MIRFPPTSIALSQSDIDFHLREIQIKEHLYAQGFTKKEVQRYYSQRHGDVDDPDDDVLSSRPPSSTFPGTGEDSTGNTQVMAMAKEPSQASGVTSIRSVPSIENVKNVQKAASSVPDTLSSSPISVLSSPPNVPVSIPYRHAAVRHSSLLRIMHTAHSQPSTTSNSSCSEGDPREDGDKQCENETQSREFLQSPATRIRSYRPRSRTYTFIESEAAPPTPPSKIKDGQSNGSPVVQLDDGSRVGSADHSPRTWHAPFTDQSSSTRPEPDIPSPLTLPPPLSLTRRRSSLQFTLADRTRSSGRATVDQHDSPIYSSPLFPSTSSLRRSRPDISGGSHVLTTPSFLRASSDERLIPFMQEESHQHLPSTPTRAVASSFPFSPSSDISPDTSLPYSSQTEPRNAHRHHLSTFGVYNDHFPAESQPQTPADLQSPRRRAVAERNVAYTAPPGQIRTPGRLIQRGYDGGEGVGSRSPTLRATRMRAQRAREFGRWRNVRLETMREVAGVVAAEMRSEEEGEDEDDAGLEIAGGAVTIGTDRSITPDFARNTLDGMADGGERAAWRLIRQRAMPRSRMGREVDWRDVFDEDRVGSENFEGLEMGEMRDGRLGGGMGMGMRTRTRRPTGDDGDAGDAGDAGFAVMARTPEP